jgi:hypothetical protein
VKPEFISLPKKSLFIDLGALDRDSSLASGIPVIKATAQPERFSENLCD